MSSPTGPDALVVDLAPIHEFVTLIEELEAAWAALSPAQRGALSRMLWLHPDGRVVAYRTDTDPPERG